MSIKVITPNCMRYGERPPGLPTKFWAVCRFYEPFVMGGHVAQRRRFLVDGYPREFTSRGHAWTLFCYLLGGRWQIHEKTTGAFVTSFPKAVKVPVVVCEVQHLLNITPDYAAQVMSMGKWNTAEEVDAEEAFRRLLMAEDVDAEEAFRRLLIQTRRST